MKNPIRSFFKKMFLSKKVLGQDAPLKGLVKADVLLQKLIEEHKIPGLAVTVLKKGNIKFQKGYGYANIEEKELIDPEKTKFRVASVSKPIAATALAHMVAEGMIDLDASFYTYVPYYPKKEWDFTIRQLANHTAGIRAYSGVEYGLNKPYSIKESIAIFKDDPLQFKPGTDYLYTSFDWVLISLAMEEVSGVPFEAYVKERVLQPLNLENTFGEVHKKKYTNTTVFYSKGRLGFRESIPVNNYYKLAGGGFLSTATDIAAFGQAFLENKVLNKKVLDPFLTSALLNGNPTYYGLGWQVSQDKKGRPYYGHIGNGVGGYSNFFVYPEQQMVVSILINCTNPKIQDTLDEVIDSLF